MVLYRDYDSPSGPAWERFSHLPRMHANVLLRHGIKSWAQIAQATDAELLAVPNLGPRILEAVRTEQRRQGF